MGLYDAVTRKLLFRMDPEHAHKLALWFISRGLVRGKVFRHASLEQDLLGAKFVNPLGLAAGFDKNAVALNEWHKLGFGFVEVGTVTKEAQPGNPKPRMFRLPLDRALINRLGFNNAGVWKASRRISDSAPKIPFGVNIGKSRNTTPELAAHEYANSCAALPNACGYVAINVSSPNTPGLRELQAADHLRQIINTVREREQTNKVAGAPKPLFVKISPDLSAEGLDDIITIAHETKLTGIIATNTTITREGLSSDPDQDGGLSGAPLKTRSDEVLRHLYRSCDKAMILIGVGGIFTGQDLYDKIAAGAHLCQVYTGFVYGGPSMPGRALEELMGLLAGGSLAEARGSGA